MYQSGPLSHFGISTIQAGYYLPKQATMCTIAGPYKCTKEQATVTV